MMQLLDAALLGRLRPRLAQRLAVAPAHALISITLELGPGEDDWLGARFGAGPFFYWAQPAAGEFRLGLGRAMAFATAGPARFSALQAAFAGLSRSWLHDGLGLADAAPAAFLGFAFDEEEQGALPNAQLTVPAVLLQARAGRRSATFTCAARDGEAAVDSWLAALRPTSAGRADGTLSRGATPLADRAWLARVGTALADIAAGRLEKVVLTRSTRVRAGRPFQAAPVLAALVRRHPVHTIYAVGEGGRVFLGATPERLVSLAGGVVRADALAGTAWQGPGGGEASASLLSDDKNRREQRLVVDAVRAALAPLCERLDVPEAPQVLRLRHLAHLCSRIEGRLAPGSGLFDLVARVHPTPAVGGAPAAAARDWLRRHGERRGAWYAGGIGWIGPDGDGEVAVPLRCALLAGCEAELFAGAGIVAGSAPAQELAETEAKLDTMLDALAHAGSCAGAFTRTGTQ